MKRHHWRCLAATLIALPFLTAGASAQLLVSANDNKAILVDGVGKIAQNPAPDTVSVIDFNASPPKLLGEVKAPTSVVGPPESVAVAPDESFALVTGAMKIDPADATKVVPDNRLSVMNIKANPPAVLATLETGLGPSGLSINRAGTLALVANRAEGTVSIFTISGTTLTAAGKVDLGNPKAGPSHVAFTPDGKLALVTRDGDHKTSVLTVDGSKVTYIKKDMSGGIRPYAIVITPSGDAAFIGNQGGGFGDTDTVDAIDLKANPPRIVNTISVGQIVEGLALSPDGKYLAVTAMNGSNKPRNSPFYHDYGLLKVYRVTGTSLTPAAEGHVGHWCQGTAWKKDSKAIAVQCMIEKTVAFYRFNGRSLAPAGSVKISGGGAGLRTAEH